MPAPKRRRFLIHQRQRRRIKLAQGKRQHSPNDTVAIARAKALRENAARSEKEFDAALNLKKMYVNINIITNIAIFLQSGFRNCLKAMKIKF